MSYDVSINCSHGHEAWSGNMTSNVAPMWREAGADLAEFDGQTTEWAVSELRPALADMESNPEKYIAMEPSNNWGDYHGCKRFLETILEKAIANPDHVLSVYR
jgi:hypothetical protein